MKAEYVDHYGSDAMVAKAARVSFNADDKDYTDAQMIGLIGYLARGVPTQDCGDLIQKTLDTSSPQEVSEILTHVRNIPTHWAPFAHPHITLKMSAPVAIRTQCFKHKIGFTESEQSRRYIKTEPEFFFPEFFRPSAANVKQGSDDVPHERNTEFLTTYRKHCEDSKNLYLTLIELGVCPEQARFVLPQGTSVTWIWTGSLYAYANFIAQRTDPHAQKEVQDLANMVRTIIEPLFPVSLASLLPPA